jgi:HAMP domain-containing protein
MIWSQVNGNRSTRKADAYASEQSEIVQDAIDANASARGMQLAGRDARLAKTEEELQSALRYLEGRQAGTVKSANGILKLARSPENRALAEKVKELAQAYLDSLKEVAAIRAKLISSFAKQATGAEAEAKPAARIAALSDKETQLAREKSDPLAVELGSLADKIVEFAKQRADEARAASQQEMSTAERDSLAIGAAVALTLIGACVSSVLTIARPLRALTGAMRELADGNLAVALPGLGRGDEVGSIAGAVEAFRIRAEQKAQDEAAAKLKQGQAPAQQRKADMNRLAGEFEAAVGEIVETVSSASRELEASAGTLSATAEPTR